MTPHRRTPYLNPAARTWVALAPPSTPTPTDLIAAFHAQLPGYAPTRLVPLPSLAAALGVRALHVKEEADRMGAPAFKMLGASWGALRALAGELGIAPDGGLEGVRAALRGREAPPRLVAATAGNHGRAVARVGAVFGVGVTVYVPRGTAAETARLIEREGAEVVRVPGDYDDAVRRAWERCEGGGDGGVLVQDTAFEGYEDVPNHIVQGYTTLLREATSQLPPASPPLTHIVAPVGVGSFAQAVVEYFASSPSHPAIVAVEPDTAACLHASLSAGRPVTVQTTSTIMAGLNCGTVSTTAWPLLKEGVSAAVTVSDWEAHVACQDLADSGVDAGPCGGAGLAALRALTHGEREALGLDETSVVVVVGTEGRKAYDVPRRVDMDDAAEIAKALVQIDSANPMAGGPGERAVVEWVAAWLAHRGIEMHVVEEVLGRPSVVGVVRGTGGGKTLMLNGHLDTVTLEGYDGDALSGKVESGKLFGRGAADMKGGLAAAMAALVRIKDAGVSGDVIFAGVADEENLSIGTEQLLRAGWRADAAVVMEPSDEDVVVTHKGFVWLEVDVLGVASHGSRPDLGVDAISKAGYFLVELDKHSKALQDGPNHPALGAGSIHASMVKGGEEASSYPAKCTITVERRTVPGETAHSVRDEVETILRKVSEGVPGFQYDLRVTFERSPFEIDGNHSFVSLVTKHAENATRTRPKLVGGAFWADSALLADAGIPALIYGPKGDGLHAKTEWVDLKSVESVAQALTDVALEFCN